PDFTGGCNETADSDMELGAAPASLWPRIESSVADALTKIATGNFESPSADAHADLGIRPQDKSTNLNNGSKDIKDEASSDRRLFIDKPQTFSDFNLIYGIAGDHS